MQTGDFRGFAVKVHDPGIAVVTFNRPDRLNRMTHHFKRSIYNAAEMTWAQSLDEIASKTAVTDHHPDAAEGMKAFQQKRAPRFNQWLERK